MTLYGYKKEDWDALTDIQREKVRLWAYQEAWKASGGMGDPPETLTSSNETLPKTLWDAKVALQNTGNGQAYDNIYGQQFNYPSKFSNKYFNNTTAALRTKTYTEAEQAVRDHEIRQRQSLSEEAKSTFAQLAGHNNTSYSGCDITPSITVGSKTFVIGNIATISYSIHRDFAPVRTLGRAYPKSYVGATRSIAGTLVFNVFDTHVLHEVRKAVITERDASGGQSSPLTDQLPPFDVTIVFSNEYGSVSYMRIYGLQVTDEGQTHSINDIYTENIMQYVARDIDLMVKMGDEWTPQALAVSNFFGGLYNSELSTPAYKAINLKQLEIARIDREIAEINNDLYHFNDYSTVEKNILFSPMRLTEKYGYLTPAADGGKWGCTITQQAIDDGTCAVGENGVYEVAYRKRTELLAQKAQLEKEVIIATESLIQSDTVNLGSSNSATHNNPYTSDPNALTRKQFK